MKTLTQFRKIALMEGISFLLFMITMPLKYLYGQPMPNKIVGMGHGILFIAYLIWLYLCANERKWETKKIILLLASSVLPFGTFVADKKILSKEK